MSLLENIFDIHIHTSPDLRPRETSDLGLAKSASKTKAFGFVIKNHYTPTVGRAAIASEQFPGLHVYGGIVLNESIGGLNSRAVEVALAMGGKLVWLPTLDAANHRAVHGQTGGIRLLDSAGDPKEELHQILELISQYDAVLATGHISKLEIVATLKAASEKGIKRILINHPEHRVTNLSIAEQGELLQQYPLFLERCHSQPSGPGSYQQNFSTNLQAIQQLGHESTIIASDLGQIENPPWAVGMSQYLEYLSINGLTSHLLHHMTHLAPARLLGLESNPKRANATATPASL